MPTISSFYGMFIRMFMSTSAAQNRTTPIHLGGDITIGMSAFGNAKTTFGALQALFYSAEGDFELILVDDCSPDNTLSLFMETKNRHPNTKVLSFDKNLEYSGSLNALLSHAKGQWVLFLSNDIFVSPAYLREIFQAARADRTFGVVRGCSNFVDNSLATHNIQVPPDMNSMEALDAFAEVHAAEFHGQHLVDTYLTGDAFLVSRALLDRIGTFDPLFYGYFADHDFGIRARIAGFKLVLARGGFAFHRHTANFDYLPNGLRDQKITARWMKVYENWARFKLKYGLPVERPYTSMADIPWDQLSSAAFNTDKWYCPPADYSKYFR